MVAAMHELRTVQQRHRKLKWNVMFGFGIILVFVGAMVAAVFIVMMLSRNTKVGKDGAMTAPRKDTASVQLAVVETTQPRDGGGIKDLMEYDDSSDQWLIADGRFRHV